jgi:6,7-dimethyl-8-ribityllumazine synthase
MHFEYICDAVTHGLMKVQLESGTPVIFGVLTALTDDQALERAGLGRGANGAGHSELKREYDTEDSELTMIYVAPDHGEDWGLAAVELGAQALEWSKGNI